MKKLIYVVDLKKNFKSVKKNNTFAICHVKFDRSQICHRPPSHAKDRWRHSQGAMAQVDRGVSAKIDGLTNQLPRLSCLNATSLLFPLPL